MNARRRRPRPHARAIPLALRSEVPAWALAAAALLVAAVLLR